jgi:hypothetical protein
LLVKFGDHRKMIRTHILPCTLPRTRADDLNRSSGTIDTGVLAADWRLVRKKGLWLSEVKPRGRTYHRPSCGFQAHRDVVGQVNILSRFLEGDVGRIPAPADVKYRIPHDLRVMRGCRDTGQERTPGARARS